MLPNEDGIDWNEETLVSSENYQVAFSAWESAIKLRMDAIHMDPRAEITLIVSGEITQDTLPWSWSYDDYNHDDEDDPLEFPIERLHMPVLAYNSRIDHYEHLTKQQVLDIYHAFVAGHALTIET